MSSDYFVFPLSFAQERLWFLHQLEPDSPLYNVPAVTCRISGPLHITALERSLAEIVQRHESLRTTFGQVDGQPVQVIHPFIPFTIQIFDLGHLAPEQREAEALRIAGEEVRRPFDLAHGPLFWAVLLRLAAEEHILVETRPYETRPYETRPYVPPRNPLEQALARMWQEILSLDLVGIHDNFFELGGDSIRGAIFINRLQKILGQPVYVVALFEAPTIASLASYLSRHYPDAVLGIWGPEALGEATLAETAVGERVDAARIAHIRQLIPPLPPMLSQNGSGPKNPPAIFVLSPPRSGSTLLRAMLGGHPLLFAPPELELLSFNTLAERKKALQGRYSFWLEGTIRALMEIKGCTADEARQIMETYEQQLTTKEFYSLLQQWIAPRLLVDKTPAYALDLEILKRMEADFDRPRYIHLLRHPCGMIHSFVEARLEQVFFRYGHPFSRRELAELIWLVCQQNILAFLREVPAERQHVVVFEELVRKPQAVMQALCDFLGLDYHPAMIRPYEGQRMTDGIHPLSRMLGDVRFHEHHGIDPSVADRWKEHFTVDFLGDVTWQLAETLGYERPSPPPARVETLIEQTDEDTLVQLLAELEGLSDDEAHRLLTEELHR